MKSPLVPCLTFALSLLVPLSSVAVEPRTDINPALLYSQAIQLMPDRTGQDHLFTNEWRGRVLDDQFSKQIATYDTSFKVLRVAARQKVPCDWGHDLSQGPELALPGLAKSKLLAMVSRLRLRWHLDNGRPDDACEDFLAAYVLGRHTSRDGILISALVDVAIENLLMSGIAENWFRLTPETVQRLGEGIASAPARGTMAQCVPTERIAFKDWLARRITQIQATSASESEALEKSREVLRSLVADGDAPSQPGDPTADKLIQSAGGTTAGLLLKLQELDPLYAEAETLLQLPYGDFNARIKAFRDRIETHPNLFARLYFPALEKCRVKELALEVKLAMLQVASEFRRRGDDALHAVLDPSSGEPFGFRRFELGGADRGFELRSKMEDRGWIERVIFLESDGPPFHVDGKNAGQPVK